MIVDKPTHSICRVPLFKVYEMQQLKEIKQNARDIQFDHEAAVV